MREPVDARGAAVTADILEDRVHLLVGLEEPSICKAFLPSECWENQVMTCKGISCKCEP